MRLFPSAAVAAIVALALTPSAASAQVPRTLTDFGSPVFPAFEGWYLNGDGTATILIGYFNQNLEQEIDLPVGELNYFSPGEQDRGQPTRFEVGRAWGVFSIQVPEEFDGELTWTLVANDQPVTIPFSLNPPYFVEPLKDPANNNEPPTIRFTEDGEGVTGPPIGVARTLAASAGVPTDIGLWLSDVVPDTHVRESPARRRPPMALRWHVVRGPGAVTFEPEAHEFDSTDSQHVVTGVTFAEAGAYLLRAEALDATGEGGSGFQCCWTSALIEVNVTE